MNDWREEDWYGDEPSGSSASPIPPGACLCGSLREPERIIRGSLSLLLCRRCGKPTTERK